MQRKSAWISDKAVTRPARSSMPPAPPHTGAGAPWEGNQGGPQSIAKILAWDPVPADFTPEEESRVLGVEAAVWTEFIETERYLQFMTFPRMLALAEVAWRPKGERDAKEFDARLQPHIEGLRARGINARRGEGDAYEFITN